MFMNRSTNVPEDREEPIMMPASDSLQVEPFTPLSARVASDQPELVQGLKALQQGLGQEHFDRYIENLVSLQLREGILWMVTRRAMHRSLLERDFLPQIKQAFGVGSIRIISQG
ncbi:hypothetical protein [Acetonema longum]|uniref:DnaA N-terminal domain-containing protein n=1 Tax=Acetonema longum DSM 6540 TaxID=1009370 RepID=F7NPT8_9FIRM|nr:hypothetical protein [Acetonema longum]EGO61929.1 hypothetical protein ALO_20677 [Acetonema longum DSM 6540]